MLSHLAVNGWPLPERLVALVRDGHSIHPGDARLRELIPFMVDPVVFLSTPEAMAFESSGGLADDRGGYRPSSMSSMEVELLGRSNCLGWMRIGLSSWPSIAGRVMMSGSHGLPHRRRRPSGRRQRLGVRKSLYLA